MFAKIFLQSSGVEQTAGNLAKARKRFVYVYAEWARGKKESKSSELRTDSRMRTLDGFSDLPGTTTSTWLLSREHVDSRNLFTSSLIGSKVLFPAHEGPSSKAGG